MEEEIDFLFQTGVKRRETALRVVRLMVRAEDVESRLCLLRLMDNTDQSLHKAYLEFRCLKIIHNWMESYSPPPRVKSDENDEIVDLREEVLSVLTGLVISHVNYVEDSKIQNTLEKWCGYSIEEVGAAAAEEADKSASDSASGSPGQIGDSSNAPAVTTATTDPRANRLKAMLRARTEDEYFSSEDRPQCEGEEEEFKTRLAYRSVHLLRSWRALPRLFRIPKVSKVESTAEK